MAIISEEQQRELDLVLRLSKTIVLKDQIEADIYEALVIRDTISYDYKPLHEDWKKVTAFINFSSSDISTEKEKYWLAFEVPEVNEYTNIAIDKTTQELWLKISSTHWQEQKSRRLTNTLGSSWPVFNLNKGIKYHIDLYKAEVYISKTMWYEETSERFSNTRPTEVTKRKDNKSYPSGLSSVITTPQEYVTATYELMNPSISNARRTELTDAINEFSGDEEWEDIRQPYFLRNSNGILQTNQDGTPKINPKRFKVVPFKGEKNRYYRQLVADYGIDPFIARTAQEFEILYHDYLREMNRDDVNNFIGIVAENIQVFKHTIYNGIYRQEKQYHAWCRLYIIWMSIMRYESNKMDNIKDIDKLDNEGVTNLLYSANLFQFNDIPLTYKRRIVKSSNRLLSRKGTTQVFEDILKLFNLDQDVRLLKYHLLKYHPEFFLRLKLDSNYINNFSEGDRLEVLLGSGDTISEYFDTNLDTTLKNFVLTLQDTGYFNIIEKVDTEIEFSIKEEYSLTYPINSYRIVDSANNTTFGSIITTDQPDWFKPDLAFLESDINTKSIMGGIEAGSYNSERIKNYDNFIANDTSWQASKDELKQQDFSVVQSKYFSISTAIDLVQNSMAISFLWNMLKYLEVQGVGSSINILQGNEITGIQRISLFEAMTGMLCLTLWKHDISDIIPHESSGIETIISGKYNNSEFPYEDSLIPNTRKKLWMPSEIDTNLEPDTVTASVDRNLDIFSSIKHYMNGFYEGRNTYYKLDGKPGVTEALSDYYHLRDIEEMHDHKFTAKTQYECFGNAGTYSEWIENFNPEFRQWLNEYDNSGEYDDGILFIANLIENRISTDNFSFSISTGTNALIINYIERLVRFFKSYTVDLKEVNTYFQINDPNFEAIRLMNVLSDLESSFYKMEYVEFPEDITANIRNGYFSKLILLDAIHQIIYPRATKDKLLKLTDFLKDSHIDMIDHTVNKKELSDIYKITANLNSRDCLVSETKNWEPDNQNISSLTDRANI